MLVATKYRKTVTYLNTSCNDKQDGTQQVYLADKLSYKHWSK